MYEKLTKATENQSYFEEKMKQDGDKAVKDQFADMFIAWSAKRKELSNLIESTNRNIATSNEDLAKSTGEYSTAMKQHNQEIASQQKDLAEAAHKAAMMGVDMAKIQAKEFDVTTLSVERLREKMTSMGDDYSNLVKMTGQFAAKPAMDVEDLKDKLRLAQGIIDDISQNNVVDPSIDVFDGLTGHITSVEGLKAEIQALNDELAKTSSITDSVGISFTQSISHSIHQSSINISINQSIKHQSVNHQSIINQSPVSHQSIISQSSIANQSSINHQSVINQSIIPLHKIHITPRLS